MRVKNKQDQSVGLDTKLLAMYWDNMSTLVTIIYFESFKINPNKSPNHDIMY